MFPITSIEKPTEEQHKVIFDGINEFARSQGLNAAQGGFYFVVYDEKSAIQAAIFGYDNFGMAEIGALWVSQPLRGQGYGHALVERAASWGRAHGCKALTVFTLQEWPSYSFYLKLGFKLEFERPGHANGTTGCYLIKSLAP